MVVLAMPDRTEIPSTVRPSNPSSSPSSSAASRMAAVVFPGSRRGVVLSRDSLALVYFTRTDLIFFLHPLRSVAYHIGRSLRYVATHRKGPYDKTRTTATTAELSARL